ncbi:MAG: IS4 family transposase [Anaerolineae bacterium]|nr:IS4 family transposase [Anaerolineae bacterium]
MHLSLIARKLPVRAKKASLEKRLRRLLNNGAIRPRQWYRPIAVRLIAAASSARRLHLIIDGTRIGFGFQLLIVVVAYQGAALPLVWTWVRHRRGHSTTVKQIKLLRYVQGLIPPGVKASLVGDCEFGNALLLEQLDVWGWDYALRQPGDHLCKPYNTGRWLRLDALLPLQPGLTAWIGRVLLTKSNAYPTCLVLHWRKGEPQPWFLATNLPCAQAALKLYRRRMWIEELFGDLKGHGFDLEATHLQHFLRLSRLTLAVCILYVWLVAVGEHTIASHQTDAVDRHDRRDLSVFRLGWDFIERCLALDDPVPLTFVPNFCSVSGS